MRVKSLLLHAALAAVAIIPARAVPPVAATEVKAYAPNQSRVHVAWKDNATDETAYYIDRRLSPEGPWIPLGIVPANVEVFRGLAPSTDAQTLEYRVAPFKPGEVEANLNWSPPVSLTKPSGPLDLFLVDARDLQDPYDDIVVPEGWEARVGVPFSHQIEVRNGTPESYIALGLENIPTTSTPVELNSATGVISGTASIPGVYRIYVGVTFNGGDIFEEVRFLRVLPGTSKPAVAAPNFSLPTQNIGVEGFLDIRQLFSDPNRPKGVWFDTSQGSFIVALFDSATPKTVTNFLSYVNRGAYNNTYVHRLSKDFIFQAGGGGPASATAPPTQWRAVANQPPNIQNEPGISNTAGTIAMAKRGDNPDSATNEWFVNLDINNYDNPGTLDRQNGGFAAFGRIVGSSGKAVADSFNNLKTADYSSKISGVALSLGSVPVNDAIAPATPGPNSLVRVYSVVECPPVVITVYGNSNPSVLNASVTGMLLYIRSLGPVGTTLLTLRATNLDGETVNFLLPVTIDDVSGPGVVLTKIRGTRPLGSLLVKGRATDNVGLGRWKYRVNRGKWKNGGMLSGKSAVISKKMNGFRNGKNSIEIEVYDRKGNSSGILKQKFTLG